jgi:peptidoglycan/xylan/chitin deacetylase (PgdA/CDA1 family)
MRKLDIFLACMSVSGGMAMARALARLRTPQLLMLAYHRVLDAGPEDSWPFDIELVSASREQFDWQLRYVKEHYDAITFRDVIAAMDGGPRLPKRPVIITFDDGFDDNFQNAFPLLRDHGLPATFFISTQYIDSARTFWFDRVAALMMVMPPRALSLPELDQPLPTGDDIGARRASAARLLEVLKAVPDARRVAILELADREWGDRLARTHSCKSHPMTWDQVRAMQQGGMEFGSHTHTHPILSRLTPPQLEHELAESRRILEKELGRPCEVISYPVGMGEAVSDSVEDAAVRAGYRMGCTYETGANEIPQHATFDMRRQHVERYTSQAHFKALLAMPGLG